MNRGAFTSGDRFRKSKRDDSYAQPGGKSGAEDGGRDLLLYGELPDKR